MIWRDREWKSHSVRMPGDKGTLKPYQQYGDDLVCVRYRQDGNGLRIKTVELVVSIGKVGRKSK